MKQLNNEAIIISVVIITRNRAEMLKRCLGSLVNQTVLPNEVVVVDNDSTDNTMNLVLTFKKKLPIKYVVEKQIGIPCVRNKGLRHATGELILMLDDDCEADKNWVENMIKAHKKYPKAWAIQGRTHGLPPTKPYSLLADYQRSIHFQNCAKNTPPLKDFFSKKFSSDLELATCNTQNLSFKKRFLKINKLLFDENLYRGSDTDFANKILQKNGSIIFCPNITVGHWERTNLPEFLKQHWNIGRTAARIADKWKTPPYIPKVVPKMPSTLLLFCKILNQWHKFPILLLLLYIERVFYLNGYFYEKRILSHSRHSGLSRISHYFAQRRFWSRYAPQDDD